MAITDERIREILDGRDVDALLTLINDPQVSEEQRPEVVPNALYQLEELFYEGLPDLVVQICVEAPEKTAFEARHRFLSPWLRRDGYYSRSEVIARVISKLQTAKGEQLIAALRTAWVIGYRDNSLQDELVRIAGLQDGQIQDENAQGYALTVLSSMAYPDSQAIVQTLRSRLNRIGHLTEPDCWTALQAASPEMIPALREAAKSNTVAVSALLKLATRYPESSLEVWKAFDSLEERDKFGYVNSLARRVDLEEVGRYLLSEVLAAFEQYKQRNVLPSTTQLLEANLPNHIRVFQSARDSFSLETRDWLKQPAVTPTGDKVNFQTVESLNKESAWKVILRLGLGEAREWLPEAMSGEINYTFVKLAEIAGFLQVENAVDVLTGVVLDESVDIVIGLGSLESLGVIGSRESLDALLKSRVRVQSSGESLLPMAQAEALVSACMTQRSCESVWNVIRNGDVDKQLRELCAYVIEDLSTFVGAPLPTADEIVNLLRAEGVDLPGYDHLVLSLTRFNDDAASLGFLRELGTTAYESNKLTQALALTGLLNEFPERIEKLGLRYSDKGWAVAERLSDTAAFALLCLYRNNPTFELAMRQALADRSSRTAIQITANLRSTDRLSPGLRQSLWDRALQGNGPNSSDRSSLEAVANTWPEKLMEESTVAIVSRWSSSARRAYLSSLRAVLEARRNPTTVSQMACRFLVDGEGDVRRDAARLARDADSAALRHAVDQLVAEREQLDQAMFLLDAAFWLEDDWKLYEAVGRSHREPLVRELTERLSRERFEATLANEYLRIVLESYDYLDTWCYGQALLELGNEETINKLHAGLPSEVYRRTYLLWLAKELQKRLERRRRDQSAKIQLPPPTSYEQPVEVTVELMGERLGPFSGVLQERQTRRAHSWLWSWSIRIENELELLYRLGDKTSDDEIRIETADGRRGRVLPVRAAYSSSRDQTEATVFLLGQGGLEQD